MVFEHLGEKKETFNDGHDVRIKAKTRYVVGKDGKEYVIHETIISDIKPLRYYEVVVANGRKEEKEE